MVGKYRFAKYLRKTKHKRERGLGRKKKKKREEGNNESKLEDSASELKEGHSF